MERKKAIVTGASHGIGSEVARCLARDGYDLAVSYATHRENAEQLAAELLETYGCRCHAIEACFDRPGAATEFFSKAVSALGALHLLVNNAGASRFESILDLTEEAMDFTVNLSFRTYLLLMREAGRHMARQGLGGCIINVTSSRAERAYPGDAVYGAVKAGITRAAQSAALDLAPYGIRVNSVAPGAVRVRSKEEQAARYGYDSDGSPKDFWDTMGPKIPAGRVGLPSDIGEAVAFLASARASYITGVTLRVDGGLILPGMPEGHGDSGGAWGGGRHKDY